MAILDGTLYQVHSLAPLDPRPHSPLVRLRILVERAANYFWLGQRTLEKRRPFRSSPWARRLLYVACRLFAFAFLSRPHFRGEHSMTRLLVECTYVFEHPKVNSGIQRVVRNVIRELPEADETVECIPVAFTHISRSGEAALDPTSAESTP